MFEFDNFTNVASSLNIGGVSRNIKKQCNTKKLPDKTPKLHIIPAILRITKKNKKEKNPQEEMKSQLLESIQTGGKNFKNQNPKQIKTVKLLQHSTKRGTLQEHEEQNFDTEIQEIIEILRNALMNINSDGETRELHSAVNVFIKSGFQTFKEHRKHIEKAMLHINSHNLLKKEAKTVNLIRSKVNKLNEINSIKNLRNKEVKTGKEKDFIINR